MADYPEQPSSKARPFNGTITDVSTADQIFIPVPFRYKVTKYQSALNGAISGADAVLTMKIGGTAVTNGTITIANSGSAAGDVDTARPTSAEGDANTPIEIETNGASTGTVSAFITVLVEPT